MQRSLLMLVTLAVAPMVSAEAQRSRSEDSDSTKSRSRTVVSTLGFGAGFASGMFGLLAADDEVVNSAAPCAGGCGPVRRSVRASGAQTAGSTVLFQDGGSELDGPGNSGGRGISFMLATDDANAPSARPITPPGLAKQESKLTDVWMPLTTPAADAPGIAKRTEDLPTAPGGNGEAMSLNTVPPVNPVCSTGTCPAYEAPLEFETGTPQGLPNETAVLNDLTGDVGVIVNPEPGTIVLTVLGLGALALMQRRRRSA